MSDLMIAALGSMIITFGLVMASRRMSDYMAINCMDFHRQHLIIETHNTIMYFMYISMMLPQATYHTNDITPDIMEVTVL